MKAPFNPKTISPYRLRSRAPVWKLFYGCCLERRWRFRNHPPWRPRLCSVPWVILVRGAGGSAGSGPNTRTLDLGAVPDGGYFVSESKHTTGRQHVLQADKFTLTLVRELCVL